MKSPHSKTKEEIFQELQTSKKGLSIKEAKQRINQHGLNEIAEKKKTHSIFKFFKQFNSPLIYILFIAMIISFIFNHLIDAYVILAIVLVNAVIGFVQERKAERAIDSLKKMVITYAKVLRNNELTKIPAKEIAIGDIVLLEEGDKVPADCRIIEYKNFKTQEASLTGESFPQEKSSQVLNKSIVLSDRINMVFMGTIIVSGQAKAVVVATANKTAIGQVAKSIQDIIQPKIHLNKKIDQLAIQMAIFAIAGALITFLVGFFIRGLEFFEIFLFTIASLVSGIPEGLPAVLIIVLAVGARKMAKKNAIIRHLPAIETLGVATIIATDKTGTLTENSMTVEKIITSEGEFSVSGNAWNPIGKFFQNRKSVNPLRFQSLKKLLHISSICNKGNLLRKENNYEPIGDPTEVALIVLGKKAGFDKKNSTKITDDLPFSSESKLRASLVELKNRKQLYSVGAFENILNISSHIIIDNKKIKLNQNIKQEYYKKAESLAKKGMRILALCYKDLEYDVNSISGDLVNDMVFVGLVGMKDPPRKNVKLSIQKAKNAGIRIIMKTGDHKETALAIAKEIGLAKKNEKVFTEQELEKLSPLEFRDVVKRVNIFARVTPKMKLKIVQTLQEQGEIVAMTGDGVNDAPALKRADIGIAMGIIGTDVARESSEMILADDDFSSIVNAIEEGRTVFRNIRRTSFYLVTTNVAEDITIIASLMIGLPLPMLPIQLLYLNLVTDGLNDVALSMEPSHEDVLSSPPKNKKEFILSKQLIPFLLLIAGLMVLGTIPLFNYFLPQGINKARTVAFVSMSLFQMFNVLNMRSLKRSLFKLKPFSNKWIILSLITSFLLMLGVIYLPWISDIFQFVNLSFLEFLLISLIASSVFFAGEIYKWIRHRN